jgi:maleate isomerase
LKELTMDARFQPITDRLLAATKASRTTIRLDLPEGVFPVVAESLAPGVNSIAGQEVPGLRQAPTMVYLAETLGVLVQNDLLDTDTPPPPALIQTYGARAQMIAAIVRGGAIAGIVSVHHGPDPRHWTEAEVALIKNAAAEAQAALLSEPSR